MERQTRQLLRTIADGLTDGLLDELARGERLETDLQRALPGSRQSISRRLEELELWGLVVAEVRATPGRGRPTRVWRLASSVVLRFRQDADGLLLQLLEERAASHRRAIGSPAKSDNVRHLRA
jgi:predicted ArsR family transcriptional regulator